MHGIKNIVFDFGGVLLDIDYCRTQKALQDLLGYAMDLHHLPAPSKQLLYDYETGRIGTESFLWGLQYLSKKGIPDGRALIDAWNAMLIGWNPLHFDLLTELKSHYSLYLLSNTNALHLEWVYNDLKMNHGITDFDDRFFHKTFYSHLIGRRKPDEDIFTYVAENANLRGKETIFIDDLRSNTEAAAAAGWHIWHHCPQDSLSEVMEYRLGLM